MENRKNRIAEFINSIGNDDKFDALVFGGAEKDDERPKRGYITNGGNCTNESRACLNSRNMLSCKNGYRMCYGSKNDQNCKFST